MSRKRTHRIPIVPKGGEWDPLTPDQRTRIAEKYTTQPIPRQFWAKVDIANLLYMTTAVADRTAVPLGDFVLKLQQLKAQAQSIKSDFAEDKKANKKEGNRKPREQGRSKIEQLKAIQKEISQGTKISYDFFPAALFELLEKTLNAAGLVCDYVATELKDPEFGGHRAGYLWKYWVYWIFLIAKEHGLPHTARNDTRKPNVPMSPFVRFVQELQNQFPPEFRNSDSTEEALAKAIGRVRTMDIDCKFTDVVDVESIIPGATEILR